MWTQAHQQGVQAQGRLRPQGPDLPRVGGGPGRDGIQPAVRRHVDTASALRRFAHGHELPADRRRVRGLQRCAVERVADHLCPCSSGPLTSTSGPVQIDDKQAVVDAIRQTNFKSILGSDRLHGSGEGHDPPSSPELRGARAGVRPVGQGDQRQVAGGQADPLHDRPDRRWRSTARYSRSSTSLQARAHLPPGPPGTAGGIGGERCPTA